MLLLNLFIIFSTMNLNILAWNVRGIMSSTYLLSILFMYINELVFNLCSDTITISNKEDVQDTWLRTL
jgi:hypothetical protein